MRKSDADKKEAIERLHELLKPGSVIYTIARHVSRSGMQREISCAVVSPASTTPHTKMGYDVDTIDHLVCNALGYRRGKHGGIVVGGCGMDMGFHLVYNLGRVLYPDGTKKPHGMRNGKPDSDGGYALKHRWL